MKGIGESPRENKSMRYFRPFTIGPLLSHSSKHLNGFYNTKTLKQELMKMPLLNSWEIAPTSRELHWFQPTRLLMERLICYIYIYFF